MTVGGLQYDVTTFTGSYNNSTNKFANLPAPGAMPWWGNAALADQFFRAVGTSLGLGVNRIYGLDAAPAFAYGNYVGGSVHAKILFTDYVNFTYGTVGPGDILRTQTLVYAQATLYSVPGPLPLFGAAAAFGYSRKLRKRTQVARSQAGAGLPLA